LERTVKIHAEEEEEDEQQQQQAAVNQSVPLPPTALPLPAPDIRI